LLEGRHLIATKSAVGNYALREIALPCSTEPNRGAPARIASAT
jgi:hypothetical protein